MTPQQSLQKYLRLSIVAVDAINLKIAQDILDDSNALVPVDSGNLQRSGEIYVDNQNKVQVYYTEDYAIYVHEDLSTNHPNGEAKFLEKSINKNKKKLEKAIAAELKRISKI